MGERKGSVALERRSAGGTRRRPSLHRAQSIVGFSDISAELEQARTHSSASLAARSSVPSLALALLVLALLGWPSSIAWFAAGSFTAASIAPLSLSVASFVLTLGMLILMGDRARSTERILRTELIAEAQRAAEAEAKVHRLQDKLGTLGSSHDTMYALLFKAKSRRATLQKDVSEDESFVNVQVRDFLLAAPESRVIGVSDEGDPSRAIPRALDSMSYDSAAALRAATRIRDPAYDLRAFYVDVRTAFPELSLYVVARENAIEGHTDITSGVSAEAEYRRTLGALFAIYWLARIGIDGERGFSFGVDDNWVPRPPPDSNTSLEGERRKRMDFFLGQDWPLLQQLLVDSGCLVREGSTGNRAAVRVDAERMVAMLALTAIHDVMKVDALLPRVGMGRGVDSSGFEGFKAGDIINDHDVALGYVLHEHPDVLPSFAALPLEEQRTLRFTQGKMGFNHGWLVQAEAPPHALFSSFKKVIEAGGAQRRDVAFYFVHWLTDLAGAVPSPLEGSEKFVLQFPSAVLASFVRSFDVLHELATNSETAVFEAYLESRWVEICDAAKELPVDVNDDATITLPADGKLPEGPESIALMRLVVQAQQPEEQRAVAAAWAHLGAEDKRVLAEELSCTGIAGQSYARSGGASFSTKGSRGPAILVYYSPAFVRHLSTAQKALPALRLLAEVYRRARELWPLERLDASSENKGGSSVIVRIDQIRALSLDEIRAVYANGDSWVVYKRNELEAVVECHDLTFVAEMLKKGTRCAVLKFYARKRDRRLDGGTKSANASSNVSHSSSPPTSHSPGTRTPPEGPAENSQIRRLSIARENLLSRPRESARGSPRSLASLGGDERVDA